MDPIPCKRGLHCCGWPGGGGDDLSPPWYGIVPFSHYFGYLFMTEPIYGYGFQQFVTFPGFLCMVFFVKILMSFPRHRRIYGYDFKKIIWIYGYNFQKCLQIYGWYFYDLNRTTPYLGNSSDSPPWVNGVFVVSRKSFLVWAVPVKQPPMKVYTEASKTTLPCFFWIKKFDDVIPQI